MKTFPLICICSMAISGCVQDLGNADIKKRSIVSASYQDTDVFNACILNKLPQRFKNAKIIRQESNPQYSKQYVYKIKTDYLYRLIITRVDNRRTVTVLDYLPDNIEYKDFDKLMSSCVH